MTQGDAFDKLMDICPSFAEAVEDDNTELICKIITYICGDRFNYFCPLSKDECKALHIFEKETDEFVWKSLQANFVAAYFSSFTDDQLKNSIPCDFALFGAWKNGVKDVDRSKYSPFIKGGLKYVTELPLTFDSIYFPSAESVDDHVFCDRDFVMFKTGRYTGISTDFIDLPTWNIDEFTLKGSFKWVRVHTKEKAAIKTLIIEGDTFPIFKDEYVKARTIEKIIFKPVGCSEIKISMFDEDLFAPGITIEVPKDLKVTAPKIFSEDIRKILVKK